jgi:transcriptional regulator of acetoin/glycerol metabolism
MSVADVLELGEAARVAGDVRRIALDALLDELEQPGRDVTAAALAAGVSTSTIYRRLRARREARERALLKAAGVPAE